MLVAVDIDGTIDADPAVMLSLMQALRAAGHMVVVVTGSSETTVTPNEVAKKKQYLQSLGVGKAYDQLVVFPDSDIANAKVKWLTDNKADVLIDNKKSTAREAPCFALVPWQTRVD